MTVMITCLGEEKQGQTEGGKLIAPNLESSWFRSTDGKVICTSYLPSECCRAGDILKERTRLCVVWPSTLMLSNDRS